MANATQLLRNPEGILAGQTGLDGWHEALESKMVVTCLPACLAVPPTISTWGNGKRQVFGSGYA